MLLRVETLGATPSVVVHTISESSITQEARAESARRVVSQSAASRGLGQGFLLLSPYNTKARTVLGRGREEPATYMSRDVCYDLQGESGKVEYNQWYEKKKERGSSEARCSRAGYTTPSNPLNTT